MKNLIYFLLTVIVLVSCKKEPNKDVNPLTKSVITGKVIDMATNNPITEGRVVLLRDVGTNSRIFVIYDSINLDQNGAFRFEFTYQQCYDCQYVRHEFPPYNTFEFSTKYLQYEFGRYNFDSNRISLRNGYSVGDKSEDITFYYHSMSKLRVNYINNTPNSTSDSLKVSINNAVFLGYPSNAFNGLFTASAISAKKVLTVENYVLANKTCSITSRIRKNGQLTVNSQEVILEPFSIKEVNIEY
jgi:hypothetical protein